MTTAKPPPNRARTALNRAEAGVWCGFVHGSAARPAITSRRRNAPGRECLPSPRATSSGSRAECRHSPRARPQPRPRGDGNRVRPGSSGPEELTAARAPTHKIFPVRRRRIGGPVPVGGEILRQAPEYLERRTNGETNGVQWMSQPFAEIGYFATRRCVNRAVRASPTGTDPIIAKRAADAGVENGRVSGHSLRVGAAQSLAAAGAGIVEMQVAGRWKSERQPGRYARNQLAGRGAVARLRYGSGQ